ncbi:hypothetical protein KVR01_013198 [Diaporthe batatas]|uniref:uncharacterized protein n=1 Tax=Diaporthe batatas TaxID=748121 RepID=UPI001D059D65|nr:uncharacterized protein KVR01_013198 [Diaporthe batatas]KAG8156976.1 hypothetical protein KVR01_013198 [Diaporthe batatas]
MRSTKCITLTPCQCEVCGSRSGLLRCSGCQLVYFCSSAHQRSHWKKHKTPCIAIKKARAKFLEEEAALQNTPANEFESVFEADVGHFGHTEGTDDYMVRRSDLVDAILMYLPRHESSVETALDHIMDMFRLNRSDYLGQRALVPSLMLRLWRDQDAYDFMKWWAMCDIDEYDWEDLELPYLDTRNADVFEEPVWWTGKALTMSHTSAVALIKLRVLFKLRDLQNTLRALQASALPREIIDQVLWELLADSLLAGRLDLVSADTETLATMIGRIMKQIRGLYAAVEKTNMGFWPILISFQDDHPKWETPESYSLDSRSEAEFMVMYTHLAWEQTPGALDEIEAIQSCQNH